MALGKNARPGKRSSSSSSSYLSTITTVGFVALCVLGVWMLTSSSVIPAQSSHSDGVERLSSSSRFEKSTVPAFEDNDLAADQDRAMSSLGRKSGLGSVKMDANDDAGSAGKLEYKRSTEEDEDENRRISTGEMDGGDAKPQELVGHESSTGDENTSGDKGVATNVVMSEEDQEKVASAVEEKTQEQKDESTESRQQAEVLMEKTEDNTQQLPATGEGNDENQQQQQQQQQQEQEQESSDSQTNGSEEIQQQSDQQQAEREQQQQQFPEHEQEPQQSKQQQTESDQEQQQSEQQQTESEQEQQQSQQQQLEGEQEQQQSLQHSEESEGDQSSNQQSQQQSDSESSDVNQQHLEVGEKDDQQYQQQQVIEESNDQNNHQVEENAASAENQESHSSEEGTTSSQGMQQEEDKLTHPHASGDMIMKQSKTTQPGSAWSTQAGRSENEKERQESSSASMYGHTWELCNVTAGEDYIPCLDNEKALKLLHNTGHYEHRERHCPEESPSCLVPLPKGYKQSIEWPKSRDKIWYNNVPHTKLAVVKGHQNWVKVTGEYLTFPGGGTQFIHGALHYIDFIQQSVPKIAWGKRTRVILDVGCGVASFGGYLFERDVLAMSFAPKDEHEAQVQFALERGIPAISAVMGTKRLTFPSRVFDIVHCARCRVPWHADGGTLLLELNRVLRPGGFFVWSATPVYQKLKEDQEIWKAMSSVTAAMCWELVTIKKDKLNSVGAAIYRKPTSNECYDKRKRNKPPMCKDGDDPNAAWYVPLQACMHRVPVDSSERGSQWPKEWPLRLQQPPYWLNNTQIGVYGKPAPADFIADYEHWKRVVSKSYLSGLGISWTNVRNVMDMRAVYGGFAAALNDLKVWVMNVVNVDSPDTLPIIYERGLFGIYHDWCESFSIYPRTYDLLHADHLFSNLKKRCKIVPVMAEVDRIVRPGGKLIVRDESNVVSEVENLLRSLHWEVRLTFSKDKVGILSAQKTDWRPETFSSSS